VTRLAAEIRLDMMVQARNRLYVIGVALALVLGAVGRWVFPAAALPLAISAFYLLFIGGSTYMFVASMILFERSEGTLEAIRVSPLRLGEYLLSKVTTLSAFALLESLIVLFVAFGIGGYGIAPLVLGVLLLGAFNTLAGIAQVARHETVTDFLIPGAMMVMVVLQLPIFHLLGMWTGTLWYLIPTRAPLLIIEAAFRPLTGLEWAYAVAYSMLSLAAAAWLARRQFLLHLVMGGRDS